MSVYLRMIGNFYLSSLFLKRMKQFIQPIGNTPLRSIRWNDCDVALKDESANPFSHTHKDRRSAMAIEQANGFETLAMITAGNGGYSLAVAAMETKLLIATILDPSVSDSIKNKLRMAGAEVIERDLSVHMTSEDIVRTVGGHAKDVTNGMQDAYAPIFDEILAAKPDTETIVVPVGSGELFLGIHRRMCELRKDIKMVGVGVESKRTLAKKLYASWTPAREKIRKIGSQMIQLSEAEVIDCVGQGSELGIEAEPSALVVFGALRRIANKSNVVLVNTGNGL